MKARFLILLALVAILAFDGGDSWFSRRRRRRHCAPSFKSSYYALLRHYRALYRRHIHVLHQYRGLVSFVLREGRNAMKYGNDVRNLGRKMIAQFHKHRQYTGDIEFEDKTLMDESHDFDDEKFDEQDIDDQDMFQDSEDFDNEDEEELKQLSGEVEDTDQNIHETQQRE
uniref:uncharacterized protein LOC120341446 n=1 Tax=Styela clava TaxID=7725 RepID=UPI00193ABC03|nr:uncharacterized protein LOC120341446 [Styela clava]